MDVPPPAGVTPERHPGPPAYEPTAAELADRLEAVEDELSRLGGRIEALAVSLESSFEAAVATEVQAAAAELRHNVSELGRILVRDLGKLPQMLTQHRQATVAELLGPARSAAAAPGEATAGDAPVGAAGAGPSPRAVEGLELEGTDIEPEGDLGVPGAGAEDGGDRTWRGHLRRHRQS